MKAVPMMTKITKLFDGFSVEGMSLSFYRKTKTEWFSGISQGDF